jgi:hypothetical protein
MENEIIVNAPCTLCIGSDKYASIIDHVFNKSKIVVSMPHTNKKYMFTKRKDGVFREIGRNPIKYLILGEAVNYGDPNF